jgi:hypothetical protein
LDNNIIVSLENGDYWLSRIIELIPNYNIEFYYSSFATYCDYFISDDKRTRNKTEVVYDMLNFNTKIISTGKDWTAGNMR